MLSTLEILRIHYKGIEQKYQDVTGKVKYDEKSDSIAAHFSQHFTKKNTSPQQYRKIMVFDILFTVNPIGLVKDWGKSPYARCTKEGIIIITFL